MMKEELFEAIGKIDAGTVERNAPDRYQAKRTAVWKKWTVAAASLLVLASIGLLAFNRLDFREKCAARSKGE